MQAAKSIRGTNRGECVGYRNRFLLSMRGAGKAISIECRHGFLLIEVICSLAFLSIVTLIMSHAYITALFLQQDGLRRLHALGCAQVCSESWIAAQGALPFKFESSVNPAITMPNHESDASATVVLSSEIVSCDQPGFQMLKITASWPSVYGHTESFDIYTGVARVHTFE